MINMTVSSDDFTEVEVLQSQQSQRNTNEDAGENLSEGEISEEHRSAEDLNAPSTSNELNQAQVQKGQGQLNKQETPHKKIHKIDRDMKTKLYELHALMEKGE